jgi:transposase
LPWRDLSERFGPWITVYKRHRRWSADGTWQLLLSAIQAEQDAENLVDWDIPVDSTTVRAHQHAAGAPQRPPPAVPGRQKGTAVRQTGAIRC